MLRWKKPRFIRVHLKSAGRFSLLVRIPGWARNQVVPSDLYQYNDGVQLGYTVSVNGESVMGELQNGYFLIDRTWEKGDQVDIHFDMAPRLVKANENVKADQGRVAVERDPLVYCAEEVDNDSDLFRFILNRQPAFEAVDVPDIVGGIRQITTSGRASSFTPDGKAQFTDTRIMLIPYYAWNHRGIGEMAVWLADDFRMEP